MTARSSKDAQGRWHWRNYAAGSMTLTGKGVPRSFTFMPTREHAGGVDGDTDELRDYLNALEAEITSLRAEKEQAEAERDRHIAFGADLMRDKVQAEKKAALLAEYADHKPDCDHLFNRSFACSCGFMALTIFGEPDALERESGGTP